MAIVVETTSTATGSNSSSLVVTAPVGINSGDLLIIACGGGGSAAAGEQITFSSTGFTESIRYQMDPGGSTVVSSVAILYKIAEAADESATDYTVTTPSRTIGAISMFRLSGFSTGDPVYHDAGGGIYQDGTTTVADTVSLSRVSQQLLIMLGNTGAVNGGNAFSFGSYQITSSDSNPNWTELQDVSYTSASGTEDQTFFCAYAVTSHTSTITQYGFTKTGDSAQDAEATAYALGIIYTPVSVTGTNNLLQTTPVTFSPLTGSTQTPTNDYIETSPDFPNQSGVATAPSVWTTVTKS